MTELRFCSASEWHGALKARFADRVEQGTFRHPFAITSFRDLPPDVHQPALLDDVFCVHRGGAKRVYRHRDGVRTVHEVALNTLTIMPRHRGADWRTEGPDDYLHIILNPRSFDELLLSECEKSRDQIELRDEVGLANPLLSALAYEMLRVVDEGNSRGQLYVDTLFTAFCLAVLRRCSSESNHAALSDGGAVMRGGMAGWRLRQIIAFMTAHLRDDITLEQLIGVSGLSRAHFFRAFRHSTGMTPGRYLERLRVDHARRAIEGGICLADAAALSGFDSVCALSYSFRKVLNIAPSHYQRWYR